MLRYNVMILLRLYGFLCNYRPRPEGEHPMNANSSPHILYLETLINKGQHSTLYYIIWDSDLIYLVLFYIRNAQNQLFRLFFPAFNNLNTFRSFPGIIYLL
jgi:hypothetical protein